MEGGKEEGEKERRAGGGKEGKEGKRDKSRRHNEVFAPLFPTEHTPFGLHNIQLPILEQTSETIIGKRVVIWEHESSFCRQPVEGFVPACPPKSVKDHF
jgi:hypothetical protein